MRWMWIDTIVAYEPEARLVAIKNVSLAEEHLHDHVPASALWAQTPVMPASLMVEGMAQTAGILVGAARGFREKVILAITSTPKITATSPAPPLARRDTMPRRKSPSMPPAKTP